jgi:hypothetical protein
MALQGGLRGLLGIDINIKVIFQIAINGRHSWMALMDGINGRN